MRRGHPGNVKPLKQDIEPLTIYTIYERPKDYTNFFVVRRWTVEHGKNKAQECGLADTLEEARKLVPWQCVRLARMDKDDPVIVENWI